MVFLLFSFSSVQNLLPFNLASSKSAKDLPEEDLFKSAFVRNRELFAAPGSSSCENFSSIFSAHSFSKAVFVDSLFAAWLECPFHLVLIYNFRLRDGKINYSFQNTNSKPS